jgi:uncharacterized repeat protein (TIGR01451 family)
VTQSKAVVHPTPEQVVNDELKSIRLSKRLEFGFVKALPLYRRHFTSVWRTAFVVLAAILIPGMASAQVSPTTTFSTAGNWTYTVPAGVFFVSVRAAGAGGGGGGADANGAGGAGGAGAAITLTLRVTPGQILSGVVGGGGGTGFTGGFVVQCAGGGTASAFGGGGAGAHSNCASGGYSGAGGAGGGGSTVALAGAIAGQAGGGGGGSGGGWNNPGAAGIAAFGTITQTSSCATAGSGAAGVVINLDGGAAGGGGGGFPGGASGAGSGDDANSTGTVGATGGGTKRGGGGGGNCYNTIAAILSAVASGIGGAGAAGNATAGGTAPGTAGGAGSIIVTLLPSVIVAKTSSGGVGTFSFTGTNGVSAQSLTTITAGTTVAGTPQLLTSSAAQTVITEGQISGFSLSAINCTGLGTGGTATVNLSTRSVTLNAAAISPGVAIICTFTNPIGLTVQKLSYVVWDPVNGAVNPKAIPGAEVRYCITLTNGAASPAATAPVINDTIPAGATYVANSAFVDGTVNIGGTCNTGAFVNGTNVTAATGGGASGTAGGTFLAGAVSATLSSINAGATRTLYFDVIIN